MRLGRGVFEGGYLLCVILFFFFWFVYLFIYLFIPFVSMILRISNGVV